MALLYRDWTSRWAVGSGSVRESGPLSLSLSLSVCLCVWFYEFYAPSFWLVCVCIYVCVRGGFPTNLRARGDGWIYVCLICVAPCSALCVCACECVRLSLHMYACDCECVFCWLTEHGVKCGPPSHCSSWAHSARDKQHTKCRDENKEKTQKVSLS